MLPSLGKFDLLLTDPPYGIGAAKRNFVSRTRTSPDFGDSDWDDQPADLELLKTAMGLCEHQIIWGGNYFSPWPCDGAFSYGSTDAYHKQLRGCGASVDKPKRSHKNR